MTLLAIVLVLTATTRLTLLVTQDIAFPPTAWLRTQTLTRYGSEGAAWKLITCPWCISFWIAVPASAAGYWAGDQPWFIVPALALTGSLVAGIIANLLD